MAFSSLDPDVLKSVSALPQPFQAVFSFRYFNSLQSDCFSATFLSDMNMVISAPTGSGKTVLFELCILRVLSRYLTPDGNLSFISGAFKTIYIAPSKALVQEKLRYWKQRLGQSLGLKCLELTGDSEAYNARDMQETDIILTTPEKFDSLTRRRLRNGGLSFFGDIALLLIDEVHLLSESRGAALEAIISRIKMLAHSPEMASCPLAKIRFVAVSATIPNIADLAEWLMVPNQGVKSFGEEMRPVKLTTKVFGYAPAKNDFLFEKRLQNFLYDMLMQYSRGKAALVFCSTRKGAQEAALYLAQTVKNFGFSNPFIKSMDQLERLQSAALLSSDKQMQTCIQCGVGYHNGGLCLNDRNLVEGLFLKGDLQVLCTTNTLAHGINLPAHTVIIKSTQYFNKEKGRYLEYDRSTILQMCGRAGRPQFDDSGLVIIMTRKETLHLYENLLGGCEMVESELLSTITEHLNAEIVQLTVSDISLAIEWLKCSFLYVRIKQNPEHYGVKKGITSEQLEKRLKEICVQNVSELAQHGMVLTDEYGFTLKPLEPGILMAKYYLRYKTMKEMMKTPKRCSMEDLLHIISRSEEIAWIQLRRSEKKILNDINCDKNGRLRFHILETNGKIKKRIQTREEKIFILANDCLAGDSVIHEMTLNQDVNAICSNGSRIARCMKECFIFQKRYRESINSMVLAKCLHQKLWNDSPYQLKQLVGVGMVTAKALYLSGITSFENLERADPRRLEIITSRKYPFGNHIKDSLLCLPPKIDIKIEEIDFKRQGNIKLIVTLTRLSTSSPASKRHFADLLIGSEEDNLILFYERIRLDEFSSPYTVTVYTSSVQDTPTNINIDLISEEYVGVDLHEKFTSKQENAKKHKHKAVEEVGVLEIQPPTRFCNRQKKEEKLNLEPLPSDVCSNTEHQDICSMPTFNLLPEEENIDDHEVAEEPVAEADAISISDNEKGRKAKISGERILQHIRRKARKLPSFETSLPCNSPNLRAVQLLSPRISNKNRRLESENQHSADLTTHVKRTKDDGTCGLSLNTIETLSADLLVCDQERTRYLKFQEGNSINSFSTPNFLIKGHNVVSAETMDVPQSLSCIKLNANLDNNFPPDSSSFITIEDSKTSGSSSPDDDIEISNRSLHSEISKDINNLHYLNREKSEISSEHNSLMFSFEYEDAEDKSVKLRSESTESSTVVSSRKSNPKHSVTLAEEQTYGMPQQLHSIACKSHRVRETLTESQDLSISFLAEENGGPLFLGCQSVFSFL